ncbi:MAG: hypothetical protein ACFFKA_00220 [Candidatus Thorarchaeota archaeon]
MEELILIEENSKIDLSCDCVKGIKSWTINIKDKKYNSEKYKIIKVNGQHFLNLN